MHFPLNRTQYRAIAVKAGLHATAIWGILPPRLRQESVQKCGGENNARLRLTQFLADEIAQNVSNARFN